MNAQLTLADRFRAQIERPLPLPGTGDTSQRFAELRRLARLDMSLARLVEAHEDARAIAAELGTDLVDATATYGVWAASGPQPVIASGSAASARLNGTLPWCGGATIVDRALVVAMFDGHPQLFDVAVADLRRVVDDDRWPLRPSQTLVPVRCTSIGSQEPPSRHCSLAGISIARASGTARSEWPRVGRAGWPVRWMPTSACGDGATHTPCRISVLPIPSWLRSTRSSAKRRGRSTATRATCTRPSDAPGAFVTPSSEQPLAPSTICKWVPVPVRWPTRPTSRPARPS